MLGRFMPRWSLSRGEILSIYIMLTVASNICGHDFMSVLFSGMTYVFYFARPENSWEEYVWPYLPNWAVNRNRDALDDLFRGGTSLYESNHLATWLTPVLVWSGFIFIVATTMFCGIALLRKQWDHERLNYPVAEVPLMLAGAGRSIGSTAIWKDMVFWLGYSLAAITQVANFLHVLKPTVPELPIQVIYLQIQESPWSAAGSIPISYFPFAFGMAWLMPLELSFSCWVFFFLTRGMLVGSAMTGRTMSNFPYLREQSAAGHIALCLTTLWAARKHLKKVLWPRSHQGTHGDPPLDSQEPVAYPVALIGVIVGPILLIGFGMACGMSPLVSGAFFILFLMITVTIARLRAEVGLPLTDLGGGGPEDMIVKMVGTKSLAHSSLVGLSLVSWLTRTSRQLPMQVHTDSLRIGKIAHLNLRHLAVAILIATFFGTLAAWWAYLHVMYPLGLASAKNAGPALWTHGPERWNRMTQWVNNPIRFDWERTACYAFGFFLMLSLLFLRLRFLWWPLHPAGYVVACNASVPRIWLPIFICWTIKSVVLRYGGLRAYKRAEPFFVGLIVGEFTAGFLRTLAALAFNIWLPRASGIGGL
jgi:hypothetical protein